MKRNAPQKSLGPIFVGIAAVLFCLVLISTAMMSGLYARYTSKNNGGDNARVAKFAVGANLSPNDVTVNLSENVNEGSYTLTTQNLSEVAVKYDVTVTAELPTGVTLTLDGNDPSSSDGNIHTFSNVEQLPSNTGTDAHTLTFSADLSEFTESATGESHSQTIEFIITVKFVQID